MQYTPLTPLTRAATLQSLLKVQEMDTHLRKQLASLDKGAILNVLSVSLPIAATIISIVGGFYTVYASTDCQGTKFSAYSRAFLYTTIGYKLAQIIMERAIAFYLIYFINHPTVAFCSYCAQTLVIGTFLIAMSTLLVLVYKSACPAVRRKIGKSYL